MTERTADQPSGPVCVVAPNGPVAPVVFDSPHSGRHYPRSFRPAVPLDLLRRGEDRIVDGLFRDAPNHGATLIAARFARTFIDPNRGVADLDVSLLDGPWPEPVSPSRLTEHGVGLIFRRIAGGVEIYDRLLSVTEVERRIDGCWRPYHAALEAALGDAHARGGCAWHVNCHSMLPFGDDLSPDPGRKRPDVVLGDLDGTACHADFTATVSTALERLGYSVARNNPYKGAELVKRHGQPSIGRHSLQIEINRRLYMDLDTLEPHDGFFTLRTSLGLLARAICDFARDFRD